MDRIDTANFVINLFLLKYYWQAILIAIPNKISTFVRPGTLFQHGNALQNPLATIQCMIN